MNKRYFLITVLTTLHTHVAAKPTEAARHEQQIQSIEAKLVALTQELARLKAELAASKKHESLASIEKTPQDKDLVGNSDNTAYSANTANPTTTDNAEDKISIGGAVRLNYSNTSYDDGSKNRGGDFDFDLFRVNYAGEIGDISLNAEIRFFDYMTAVKYAYLGYELSSHWQAQFGVTKVPFGNLPYNSNSWFFSTNYYVGLEDDHDLGVLFKRKLADNWQLDIGFFKNDELGGVDGYVNDRADRYSYDVVGVRQPNEGAYDLPTDELAEYNTFAARYAYHVGFLGNGRAELGLSGLYGDLHDDERNVGHYTALGAHLNADFNQWNLQLQHAKYRYDIDDNSEQMVVAAYAFYDTIAREATLSNINLAYQWDVIWGPINAVRVYNDFGLIYDKSDGSANTWMNATGLLLNAGAVFTYFDFVNAKNQPFVGGTHVGNDDDVEQRFNINVGYYF